MTEVANLIFTAVQEINFPESRSMENLAAYERRMSSNTSRGDEVRTYPDIQPIDLISS